MAISYLSSKAYEKALYYSDKAIERTEHFNDRLLKTAVYHDSGIIHYFLNERDGWKHTNRGISVLETSLLSNPVYLDENNPADYKDNLTYAINVCMYLANSYLQSPEAFNAEKAAFYVLKLRKLLLERDGGQYTHAFYTAAMAHIMAGDYEKAVGYVDSYSRESKDEYKSKILQLYYFTAKGELGYAEKLSYELQNEAKMGAENILLAKPALGLYCEAKGDFKAAKKYLSDYFNSPYTRLEVNSKLFVDIEKRLGLDFSNVREQLQQEIIDGRSVTLELAGAEDEAAIALGFTTK